MPSSAISAQGSVLAIGTGTGGAKTITAMAAGSPTIFTSAAHGFVNGDVITIAALVGTAAASFNGLTFSVVSKTTNTFALQVDTTGLTYTSGGRLVAREISRSDFFWRNHIRRTLPIMAMMITPRFPRCPKRQQGR